MLERGGMLGCNPSSLSLHPFPSLAGPKPQAQPLDIPPKGSFTAAEALAASCSVQRKLSGRGQVKVAKCHQARPTGQRRWRRGLGSWQGL